jgi:hypothetical protein
LNGFLTEIRTFYSLREIREGVEMEINQYKVLLEDYSQWLGTLLRNPETSKNPEWARKTTEMQKVMKTSGRKGNRKEEKKGETATEWTRFRDIMLCTEDLGEAEILFEAIEELRTKIDKLEKAKNSIIDLERYGLGKELLYITYMHDGVPEKIFFKSKRTGATEKFEFMADFSIADQIQK